MCNKYYVHWSYGSLAEIKEFSATEDMLECVRRHYQEFECLPRVYYGRLLDFAPAEVIMSWKITEGHQ